MPLWTLIGLCKGAATMKWPEKKDRHGQENVRGFPLHHEDNCQDNCRLCVDVCPTQAITRENSYQSITLDYGRCIQCQACIEACPVDALTESNEWALGSKKRDDLIWSSKKKNPSFSSSRPTIENKSIPAALKRSLHIRHVDAGSCNGCESELQALDNPFYNLERLGIFFTPSPRFADLLLVTGSVTHPMKESLLEAYHAMPEPRFVMAIGTCAVSGGVSGGDVCQHGLEGILPVDLYLPGCPPNPAAIIAALLTFLNRMPARIQGGEIAST